MPRWPDPDDDWDDDSDPDLDLVDEPPFEDESTDYLIDCPYCHREIHEESERCPYCEQYLSDIGAPPPRRPWWFVVGFLASLYVVYRWVVWW
jgi:hypothetical protein